MKRIARLTFISSVFLLLNIACIATIILSSDVQPVKYNASILQEPYFEYSFPPLYSRQVTFNSELPFLHVNTSPMSWKYYFTWLRDDWSLKNKSSDFLFLSSKRVSELTRFGNELTIEGTFTDMKSFRQNQEHMQPRVWKLVFNNFGSWESTVARFMGYLDQEVLKIEQEANTYSKVEKLSAFQNFILAYDREIKMAIYHLEKDEEDKRYLTYVTDHVIAYYKDYINRHLPQYDPLKIEYSINQIALDRNTGIYDVQVDSSNELSLESEGFTLQHNSQLYPNSIQVANTIESPFIHKKVLFKNIAIDRKSDRLTLLVPSSGIATPSQWKQKINDDNGYVYYQDILIKKPDQRFYLNLNYKFSQLVRFQYVMVSTSYEYDKNNRVKPVTHEDKFANVEFPPTQKEESFIKSVDLYNQKKDVLTRVLLISKKPLIERELLNVQYTLSPMFDPVIHLERTSYAKDGQPTITYNKIRNNQYEILLNNVSLIQQADIIKNLGFTWKLASQNNRGILIEFWPALTLKILLILMNSMVIVLLFKHLVVSHIIHKALAYCRRFATKLRSYDRMYMQNSLYDTLKIGSQFRLYILLTGVLSICYFVFLVKRDQNDFIPFLLCIWIIATAVYRIKSYIHFIFALLFLFFTTIFFVIRLEALSEKFAVLLYIMLVIGTAQAFVENIFKPKYTLSFAEFAHALSKDTTTISKLLKRMFYTYVLPLLVELKKGIYHVYDLPPHTKRDKVVLGIKIFITIIVASTITITIIVIERQTTRSGFNPTIMSVQPTLVYPSNYIIIKGKNFGWKQHDKVQLKYKGGEIYTNLWTDAKIIFIVPLHWKPGEVEIWIEKPTQWEGKKLIAKSKIVKIKILPRGNSFTVDDDAFFEQLKQLDKEVRTINGYE